MKTSCVRYERNLEEKLKVANLKSLEQADCEIQQLERKLLPATIIGGFGLLSLLPLGAAIGDFFNQREAGIMIGMGLYLASGFYWIKTVGERFYEPIFRKYNLTIKEWEDYYLNRLNKR